MNRIDSLFSRLRRKKRKALIAYVTAGFPSLKILPRLVAALAEEGADLVEIGIPFSDPLADGPTIQAASSEALRRGVTVDQVFEQVRRIRKRANGLPVVFMTYYNPVFHYGIRAFCRKAALCGVDGLIVPDLPPEESQDLSREARKAGIALIFLASPTSSPGRLRKIAQVSRGFIYCVSLTGVTGARDSLTVNFKIVEQLKRITKMPICVGFGISTAGQAAGYARRADGVIIGSALINAMRRFSGDPVRGAAAFIRKVKLGWHS